MTNDLGPQPIAQLMEELGLESGDLVSVSTEHITYKMVKKACQGRRLTPRIQQKVRNAFNTASGKSYDCSELFNY